jgi:hypothetical protein
VNLVLGAVASARRPQDGDEVAALYEIVVSGELGPTVACAFDDMRLEIGEGRTTIVGELVDQAHLAGVLRRIHDLGLEIVSVGVLQGDRDLHGSANGALL